VFEPLVLVTMMLPLGSMAGVLISIALVEVFQFIAPVGLME
jgi:hypothetical protein